MDNLIDTVRRDEPVLKVLGCLTDKFVVDFANGIDVTKDHIRVQRDKSGLFNRLWGCFTGEGARRQSEINDNLNGGLEASLQWLQKLTQSLAKSKFTITQVNDRVSELKGDFARLAHHSADTLRRLEMLSLDLNARMEIMEKEIERIDLTQKAKLNIDLIFDKWAGGGFASLSPAARCYVSLEELRWGAMGDYCRHFRGQSQCRDFIQMVINRATKQLAHDAELSLHSSASLADVWLTALSVKRDSFANDLQLALDYLADHRSVEDAPFISSIVKHEAINNRVPFIATANRVAKAITEEVFLLECSND